MSTRLGTVAHEGTGRARTWLVEAVPSGDGRKQTEAFLTWAADCTQHGSTSLKLRATLEADKIDYELMIAPT